jgi:hypothetical protein
MINPLSSVRYRLRTTTETTSLTTMLMMEQKQLSTLPQELFETFELH